eukprot:COSAG06_NODE_31685_length_517_cov_0.988038_1_plen_119_part_00
MSGDEKLIEDVSESILKSASELQTNVTVTTPAPTPNPTLTPAPALPLDSVARVVVEVELIRAEMGDPLLHVGLVNDIVVHIWRHFFDILHARIGHAKLRYQPLLCPEHCEHYARSGVA